MILDEKHKEGLTDIINLLHTMTMYPKETEIVDGMTVEKVKELQAIAEGIAGAIENAEETIETFLHSQNEVRLLVEDTEQIPQILYKTEIWNCVGCGGRSLTIPPDDPKEREDQMKRYVCNVCIYSTDPKVVKKVIEGLEKSLGLNEKEKQCKVCGTTREVNTVSLLCEKHSKIV